MERLYLIFLSSTFKDLKKERNEVAEAMRLHGYVPMGMENFTPTGEAQMDIIRRAIDKCNYYILIVGGRYGSLNKDGISYTEAEYNYAKERNLPVLAFIHDRPDDISVKNTDEHSAKLKAFCQKLEAEYYVGHWNSDVNLPLLVISALAQTINIKPAIGWVRGDAIASTELKAEKADLQKERDALKAEIEKLKKDLGETDSAIPNIAGLDESMPLKLLRSVHINQDYTWNDVFLPMALKLLNGSTSIEFHDNFLYRLKDRIILQFKELGLLKPVDKYEQYSLTERGKDIARKALTFRKSQPQDEKQ